MPTPDNQPYLNYHYTAKLIPICNSHTVDFSAVNIYNISSNILNTFGTHVYTYDYRGYLTKDNNTTYEYDGNGNVTRAGNKVFTYDSVIKDRLISVGGNAITYGTNNAFLPTSYNGNTFTYEGRRLIGVQSATKTITYKYNNNGLRTQKTVITNGVTTTTDYYYDGGKLIAEVQGNNRIDYFYDEYGSMYAFKYNGNMHYYVKDVLHNVVGIVNESGALEVAYNYDAYGNLLSVTGIGANDIGQINPIRYKGYYYDTDTGYYYCKSRYYVPIWCRWLTPDNVNFLEPASHNGLNLYAYCGNNPVMGYDPTGNSPLLILAAAVLFTPVGGTALQATTSVVSYVGMAVASIFDEDIRNDMDAIGWNPFNTDESATLNSSKVSFYKGVPVFRTNMDRSGSFGAILLTMGSDKDDIRHERGHNSQLMMMGIANYGLGIGIPSLFMFGPWEEQGGDNYYRAPWEITADKLGGVSRSVHTQEDIDYGWRYLERLIGLPLITS